MKSYMVNPLPVLKKHVLQTILAGTVPVQLVEPQLNQWDVSAEINICHLGLFVGCK